MTIHSPMDVQDGCRALWCAVLLAAVEDAIERKPKRRGVGNKAAGGRSRKKPESMSEFSNRLNDWRRARDYIGSRDFKRVCHMAGLDPLAVEERVRPMMARD